MMSKKPLIGLAAFLVRQGLISEFQAYIVQEAAEKSRLPIITEVVKMGLLEEWKLAKILSEAVGLPIFDLRSFNVASIPMALLKDMPIKHWHVLPIIQRGQQVFVALSDPLNHQVLQDIKRITHLQVEVIIVSDSQLSDLIAKALQVAKSIGGLETQYDLIKYEASGSTVQENNDGQIVNFVNKIINEAILRGASDIHFEPYEHVYRIRMRLDGVLRTVAQPPYTIASWLTSRIKVMAQLDIAERRIPQDGRFKMKISNDHTVDFRVSTCPTLFGEKIVLRILDPGSMQLNIDALGLNQEQQKIFLDAIDQPQGMIIVTGPTGSGKTVTMYTALNILNNEDNNICTVEDPVEINLPGINQVHVNTKADLTFACSLRAFLRQDPDIIMVGEIRDLETADIAVKAAQTGHLVLSTLHTNSAAETITRLMSMGMQTYNIASSILLIIAQRLARRLCPYCKMPQDLPIATLIEQGFTPEQANYVKIYKAVGCEQCNMGYKGRIGLFEMMPITVAQQQLIMRGANALEIIELAQKEGVDTIRQDGLKKVLLGLSSLEEINRVTKG